ncbi:hypothetical protein [Candidatus Aalborgicola defluviihabitans]|uniref:hypothetical protein n=1 Tax=Candidatus Aalborgicola defluviihabitans TaxID=3386187 RepID=UPI001DC354CD|nr:hypothetical protein [Burkholderiales bacterium]
MMQKQTCHQEGVCHGHAECHLPCDGPPGPNRFPFAPGVIEGPAPSTYDDWAADLAAAVIALGAVVAVLGFFSGYLNLPGWLL